MGTKGEKNMYLNRVELIGFLGLAGCGFENHPTGEGRHDLVSRNEDLLLERRRAQERTEWHCIQVWGKLGEFAAAFRKGAHLCVEGELRSLEYESNSAKVRTYDIVTSSIINLRAGQRNMAEAPDAAEAAA
jgi:hypothetical protein